MTGTSTMRLGPLDKPIPHPKIHRFTLANVQAMLWMHYNELGKRWRDRTPHGRSSRLETIILESQEDLPSPGYNYPWLISQLLTPRLSRTAHCDSRSTDEFSKPPKPFHNLTYQQITPLCLRSLAHYRTGHGRELTIH